eukprot:TRINITY_DN5314_c0_g2_i1.p1 TRINITY_DN5314_c0_g2~~TRINITY_DN5314_c0_g2_i1.p1  ORF type:complete len:399 (-),score=97.45 TRINITY_DN5314_c0_g2_i1:325-1521(-)
MLPRGSGRRGGSNSTGGRRSRKANVNQHKNGMISAERNPDSLKEEEYASTPSNGTVGGLSMTFPSQSVSMDSGSNCSPSRCSDVVMGTPGPSNALARLNLDGRGEDHETSDTTRRKKKRGTRAVGGEKGGGRGLRQFSMKVCQKVESKGRTTYNEVADELVAEFSNPSNAHVSPDQQQYDEKNIRRRVYDALNVLMAMDIISKDKKEIQWKGLPSTNPHDLEDLKAERMALRSQIEKKMTYLQELEEQIIGLENLIHRNERLYGSGNTPSQGVALPFILVQTRPQATVEIEISEDMQLVHFDFNSTPFELHDDAYVLKAMGFCERPMDDCSNVDGNESNAQGSGCSGSNMHSANMYQHGLQSHARTSAGSFTLSPAAGKNCISTPLPGILKARVKHES